MKLTFLCSDCRCWLIRNPSELPTGCSSRYEWAGSKQQAGDLGSALIGIGAAFEMSEIMLGSDEFCNSFASEWLVATSSVLMHVLSDMGSVDDSVYIYHKTVAILSKIGDEVDMKRLMPKLAKSARDARWKDNYARVLH